MNKGMSIEAALSELQKPLNGPHAKSWSFGPAVRTLIAALEQAQQQNGQLKSERDALRETGLNGQANTRAAADIYFQLIEECNIPPGGSLVQHVDGMRQRIAELEVSKLSVKLPDLASIHSNWSGEYMLKADVIGAIQAAGGTVEGSD